MKQGTLVLTALVLMLISTSVFAPDKPNIVFIFADNLGYGEIGSYGGGILRGAATPRIDSLAKERTRLVNFNVGPSCTPSRSALMFSSSAATTVRRTRIRGAAGRGRGQALM